MNKKLVLFDLDGTLLDTLEDLSEAVNYALQLRNLPLHGRDEYRKMVGHGVRNLVLQALPAKWQADDARVDASLADFKEYYTAHIDRYTHPYPGMPEIVTRLHQEGVFLAVASNKFQEGTEYLVNKFFPGIPFAAVLGNRPGFPLKPDPAGVFKILREFAEIEHEEIQMENVCYVGDTGTDMRTGKSAGAFTCGALWGFREREELEEYGADVLLAKPMELQNWIRI